jgi:hypothetical protein
VTEHPCARTTPPDWVNLLLADLVWERRACGLAAFLWRTFTGGLRRAHARGDPAAVRAAWGLEAHRWWRRWRETRRRDGGCRGR